ncbi:MAG: fumarylacetoacetate hydrolase family protein [Planctomycetota bacterium]|jgi:2-keto-4-pentenoate hydratase/2-oxohepta-3-ene-1,7-dioic acid hydratase in catechol pathway
MKIFSFAREERPVLGVRIEGDAFDFSAFLLDHFAGDLAPPSAGNVRNLLEAGDLVTAALSKVWDEFESGRLKAYRLEAEPEVLLPPVLSPSKILALGRNYAAHAKEGGQSVPTEPIVFDKLPSSLVGHNAPIILPYWVTTRIDHEVELAVVIGKRVKHVLEEDAQSAIFGYTVLNDVSARDMQVADLKESHPWLRSKSFDTFSPLGPYIVPESHLEDPHDLRLTCKVNGEVRQDANTGNMVFRIPAVISYLSKHFTLQPGDVIATGTPEGIGPIVEGDVVEATVEGIGTLRNPVVREPVP